MHAPPSGGNGGRGGSIYVKVKADLDGLSGIMRTVRAPPGGRGTGAYMHGRAAEDTVLFVPPGTVVRELREPTATGRATWPPPHPDAEAREMLEELDGAEADEVQTALAKDEIIKERRTRHFVWHPSLAPDAAAPMPHDEAFFEVEKRLKVQENSAHRNELNREPIDLDLVDPTDAPTLLVTGGLGGDGNAKFATAINKQPKYATRGLAGNAVRLVFELKSLADVGLVGLPNAGKSTFLRAVTNSRAEVASYAFTTLNPQIGTVIFYSDGTYGLRHDETTSIEESTKLPDSFDGRSISSLRQARSLDPDRREIFRMRIADCPGLLPGAADYNIGLGHDFLRHIERASVLAYVIDLGHPAPEDVLKSLRHELEAYREGLADRAAVVLANQADRVPETEARDKLDRLKKVAGKMEVIPLSAKSKINTAKALAVLKTHVERSREKAAAEAEAIKAERELRDAQIREQRQARAIETTRTRSAPIIANRPVTPLAHVKW